MTLRGATSAVGLPFTQGYSGGAAGGKGSYYNQQFLNGGFDFYFSTRISGIAEPGAPTVTSATALSKTTAEVTLTPSTVLGDVPITGYTVTADPSGQSCTIDPSAVPLSCTITNLTAGDTNTFTATTNTIGGPASATATSNAVTQPADAPGPPAGVAAARTAKTVATVTVTPPTQSDMPVTAYRVTSADAAHSCDIADTAAVPLACDVTGLTIGDTYSFAATATSGAGTSVASAASAPVSFDPAVPDAPTPPTAQMDGKTAAVVTFAAPDSDRAITGYTVTSAPDGKTCATTTALTCTVTGLTMGTDYTFTATATSKIGTSVASAASNAVSYQPLVPGAPASVVAVSSGKTVATVTVTAPQTGSDLPITKYTVMSASTPDSCEITDLTGSELSCDVTGLTIGTTYTFTATATSAAGTSAASAASNPVRRAPVVPDAPAAPTAHMDGKTSAVVTFAAPDSDRAITGYTVTSTPGGKTCTTTALTCTVTGLTIGTDYTFTVTATSTVGDSTSSPASNPVVYRPVAPDAPAAVTAVSSAKSVAAVAVTPPADPSDRPITQYTVTSTTTADSCTITDVTATPLTCDITGLSIGTPYAFTATATSAAGTSVASIVSNSILRTPVAPDLPASVTATSTGATTADVVLTPPAAPSDRPITSYTVTASPGGLTCTTTDVTATVIGCTITGLTRGESYTFTATATSSAGTSAALPGSTPPASDPVIPSTLPSAPLNVAVVPSETSVTLSWAAPVDDGGQPLDDYQVSYRATGDTTWSRAVPVVGLSTRLLGLADGTEYELRVAASTAVGTGPDVIVTATPFTFSPALTLADGSALAGATVKRGDTLTITGSDLPIGAAVTVELHSTPVTLGTATVGGNGRFSLPVTIPADAPAGAHTVVLGLRGTGAPLVESRTAITVFVPAAVEPIPTAAPTGEPTPTPAPVAPAPATPTPTATPPATPATTPAAAATAAAPTATATAPARPKATLAATGVDTGWLLWCAGTLLLGGSVLALRARRRARG
ncbi:fibronectin type III domain-containing protein [Cryobacterium arcticum]|uniref:fibronectin type III domain-containing protein n=1 Tax=Cryobacterium arcticum TaxID=670052 RepID=UPI0012EED3F7|nr:fibronectin type III domain-containing protein [Cryobacterium arcticum]